MAQNLDVSEIKAINQLLTDQDFEKIKRWNQNINSFVLNQPLEINHSSMVAWLLNPNEAHGLGDSALKAMLNACWTDKDQSEREFFNQYPYPVNFAALNFAKAMIRTEHYIEIDNVSGYVDILVMLPEDDLLICIENKTGAVESSKKSDKYPQLDKYYKWAHEDFEGYTKLFIYMDWYGTWQTSSTSHNEWVKISYDWLITLLDQAVLNANLSDRVRYLISDYSNYLKEDYLSSDVYYQQVNLFYKQFAKKHEHALNIIRNHESKLFDFYNYVNADWSHTARVQQALLENEHVFALLIQTHKNAHLSSIIEKEIRDSSVEQQYASSIGIHCEPWRMLIKEEGESWVVYLNLAPNNEESEESQTGNKKPKPGFTLKVFFDFDHFDHQKSKTLKALWDHFNKKPWPKNKNGDVETFKSSGYNSVEVCQLSEDEGEIIDKLTEESALITKLIRDNS